MCLHVRIIGNETKKSNFAAFVNNFSNLFPLSLFFNLANDGLLPPCLTRYNTQLGTTVPATLVSVSLASLVAMLFDVDSLFNLLGTGTLFAYMSVAISVLCLRYGVMEKLPLELNELVSRDSTLTDVRSFVAHHHHQRAVTIPHSISDYYIPRYSQEERSKCFNSNIATDGTAFELNQHNPLNCDNCDGCHQPSLTAGRNIRDNNSSQLNRRHIPHSQRRLSSSNNCGSYGAVCDTPRTVAVEFINQSFVTSLSNLSIGDVKQEPTQQSAAYVAGAQNNDCFFIDRPNDIIQTLIACIRKCVI